MKLEEGISKFVQAWGSLGSAWGINKSMAQIHALLLASPNGMSTDDIMQRVQLSRGNVNTNVRELINWRLVRKATVLGERKEFFVALHDVHSIAQHIMQERQRREIDPVRQLLVEIKQANIVGKEDEVAHFKSLIEDLHDFVNQMEKLSSLMAKINNNLYLKKMIKAIS